MTVRLLTDDEKIQLSEEAAVLTTTELSRKWKISRSTVTRILNELDTYAYGSDKFWKSLETQECLFEPVPTSEEAFNDAYRILTSYSSPFIQRIEPKSYSDWQKLSKPHQPKPQGFLSKMLERFVRSLLFSQHYSP